MTANNVSGIDELEEKKWLISRIDLYHKTTIDVLQNDIRKYEAREISEMIELNAKDFREIIYKK